jgi:NodT family efflux transporter outer membrane factor (OMF) lipoprotein
VAASPLFPQIAADWDAFRVILSKNGPVGALVAARSSASPAAPKIPLMLNIFNNFVDAYWEIDLFGKTQRSIEASQAQFEGAIEQKNALMVSIFGEIARNYLELRSAQQQKFLLEQNVELLQASTQLIQKRYVSGYSNLLDLEQIQVQLDQALSALPTVGTTIYRSIYALSVLTGSLPETLLEELLPCYPLPALPACLSTGLRSDLLRRRPDVRAAERELAQATATIGVAVASFFPSFTLAGLAGLESLKLGTLYSAGSKMGVYGADISLPIFQGGKLVGNLKLAEAQQAAAAFAYQQAMLTALQEAESSLAAYGEDLKTVDEFRNAVTGNQKLLGLVSRRYAKGLVGRLDELNSALILNNAQLSLLQAETAALLDLVSLYKALGGGWEAF